MWFLSQRSPPGLHLITMHLSDVASATAHLDQLQGAEIYFRDPSLFSIPTTGECVGQQHASSRVDRF